MQHGYLDLVVLGNMVNMLLALSAAVRARRYASARYPKHERAVQERLCVLIAQIDGAVECLKLLQHQAHAMRYTHLEQESIFQISDAIRQLPRLEQMAAVAVVLGPAPCLNEMISGTGSA